MMDKEKEKIKALAQEIILWGDDAQGLLLNEIGKAMGAADWDAELQCCCWAQCLNADGTRLVFTLANYRKAKGIRNSVKEDTLINIYPCGGINR